MKRIVWFLSGFFITQAASAGIYVELEDRDVGGGQAQLAQKMYVQGGNGRFVDADGLVSIIKGDTMYFIDDSDRTYIVFDKETMAKLAKQLAAQLERQKEQIAKLPPDQRAQLEALLVPSGSREVDAVDTGKTEKVDGRTCRVWEITRGGQPDDQVCVVPFASLPGKENIQAVFANFAKVFEEMAKNVPTLAGMMSNEFDAQAKVNGFPVRSRAYDNGRLGDSEQVLKVWREETIPASHFDIPAGYQPKQMTAPGANTGF
jgi:hypothetical protein